MGENQKNTDDYIRFLLQTRTRNTTLNTVRPIDRSPSILSLIEHDFRKPKTASNGTCGLRYA